MFLNTYIICSGLFYSYASQYHMLSEVSCPDVKKKNNHNEGILSNGPQYNRGKIVYLEF